MKIITLLNEKGGVGKTTLAVHLAAGLAMKGQRVVLVDADAQASATGSFGMAEKERTLYDLLVRDMEFNTILRRVPTDLYAHPDLASSGGELLLVPSNLETRSIQSSLQDATIVAERFAELDGWADTVVFDTSPTPSLFHVTIYAATDYVVYPCICEALSLEGLEKSVARLKANAIYRSKPTPILPLGIVPTMYRSTTALHVYNLKALREQYGPLVKQEIPQRIVWGEAVQTGQTVFAYAPDSPACQDAFALTEMVYEEVSAVR